MKSSMLVRLLLVCVIVSGAGHGDDHDGHDGGGHGHGHAHNGRECGGHGHGGSGHGQDPSNVEHDDSNDEHDHSKCNNGNGKCNDGHGHDHGHENDEGKDPSTLEKIFLNPFSVCAYLTVIAALMGLVPERIIKQYNGVFIGVCCGAVAAIVFAELIPESIELAYKHGHAEKWGSVCDGNHDHDHHHDDEGKPSVHFMSRLLGGLVLAGLMMNLLMELGVHALMPGGHSHFGDECNDPSHNHGHSHAVAHGHDHGCQAHGNGDVKSIQPCEIEDPTNPPPRASWCMQFLQIPISVWIFTVAMTLHHIGDGLLVGLQKKNLQKCATIAIGIAAHEFPHCLGAISYFVTQGCQKTHAIVLLLLSGSGYFIGVGTIYLFEKWEDEVELYGTFLVLGVFLYVLFFILMPEFMKFDKGVKYDALIRGGCFLLSLSTVSALIYVLHTH